MYFTFHNQTIGAVVSVTHARAGTCICTSHTLGRETTPHHILTPAAYYYKSYQCTLATNNAI